MQEDPAYATHAMLLSGDPSMENKYGVNCPCGFSFVTPHGQDDAVAVIQLHVDRIHKQDFPNGLSREDALKALKEAK